MIHRSLPRPEGSRRVMVRIRKLKAGRYGLVASGRDAQGNADKASGTLTIRR